MGARERAFRRTLILLAVLGLAGCSAGKEEGRTYTVRGQVTQLPDPGNPGTGLYLNHEAIDDFVSRDGEMVGMDPMTMSFLVDEEVPLEGIGVGDVVEFKLHVDWGAETEAEIVEIRELPPGTKLVYRAAQPKKEKN
jgi:hypothetical protein